MKHFNTSLFRRSLLILAVAVTSVFTSCKNDDDDEMGGNQSIAEIVMNNTNFSLLESALVHAGLTSILNGEGNFTVFAPNNSAFAAAGYDTEAKIKAVPAETLRTILLYHVLNQKVASSGIAMATNSPVSTAANQNVYITRNSSGVFVNGASVIQADVMARNGIIHVINMVLMPPMANIVGAAQANSDFSFLVAAVLRASQGSTNVAEVLSGQGPFTVFAPTNQAFMNAGFANIAAIQAANPATLTNILTYHVVGGRILSSDLTEGAQPTTVNGAKLTVTLTGGAKVKGNGNSTAASITSANMLTTNGVIHVIDQVLMP